MAYTIILPTDDNNPDQWTASSGVDKYAMVTTNDGDSNYVECADSNLDQEFTFSVSLPSLHTRIATVDVIRVIRRSGAATVCKNNIRFNVGVSLFRADYIELTDSYVQYVTSFTANPNTGVAWTKTEVEAITEVGVEAVNQAAGDAQRLTYFALRVQHFPTAIKGIWA